MLKNKYKKGPNFQTKRTNLLTNFKLCLTKSQTEGTLSNIKFGLKIDYTQPIFDLEMEQGLIFSENALKKTEKDRKRAKLQRRTA